MHRSRGCSQKCANESGWLRLLLWKAFELGFKRVAVSVVGFQAKTLSEIRKFEVKAEADVSIFPFATHVWTMWM